jgi:hypothetical protein
MSVHGGQVGDPHRLTSQVLVQARPGRQAAIGKLTNPGTVAHPGTAGRPAAAGDQLRLARLPACRGAIEAYHPALHRARHRLDTGHRADGEESCHRIPIERRLQGQPHRQPAVCGEPAGPALYFTLGTTPIHRSSSSRLSWAGGGDADRSPCAVAWEETVDHPGCTTYSLAPNWSICACADRRKFDRVSRAYSAIRTLALRSSSRAP